MREVKRDRSIESTSRRRPVRDCAHERVRRWIALDGNENVYVCNMSKHSVVKVNVDMTVTTFCDQVEHDSLHAPNFCVFHPGGDLYATDSGDYWHSAGRLLRFHRDGTSELLIGEHLNFPQWARALL
jgi:sugar lactone lactonase YvrE